MNTSKQINAMIVLMALLLVGVGAYTIWDPYRQETELERTKEVIAERAAHTYARNCRVCHGNAGEGRVAPALNPQFRVAANLRDFTDPSRLVENQQIVRNTIMCGRVGTIMPPWAIDQGGSLNNEQIRQLVILITENPGGKAWDRVKAISEEEEKIAPMPSVQDVLKGASITGATTYVCGQKPVGTPAPTATPTPPAAATSWTIVATDNKFDITAITIPAGQPVTVTLNNRGQAIHNWHVLNLKDREGKDITTKLLSGGQSETITFTVTQTGTFEFLCDVHPVEMRGTLFVQ